MGSEKYPGENEFDKFISQHGGTNDACTDYETVNKKLRNLHSLSHGKQKKINLFVFFRRSFISM